MVAKCPKCDRTVPEDSVYCPYCAHPLQSQARTTRVHVGSVLLIVAGTASLILFIISTRAILLIYTWYPQLVAQSWFIYDQLLVVFTFLGMVFGFPSALLTYYRKSHKWTLLLAVLCTVSGMGTVSASVIAPNPVLLYTIIYYFLPLFFPSLIATLVIYPRKAEFEQ